MVYQVLQRIGGTVDKINPSVISPEVDTMQPACHGCLAAQRFVQNWNRNKLIANGTGG